MDSVLALQVTAAVLLNGAFAWLVGTWLARRWLSRAGVAREKSEGLLRSSDIRAAVVGVLGALAAIWASTAVMGGVGLLEAKDLVWQMLSATTIGRAAFISLAAIAVALILRVLSTTAPWRDWAVLFALAVFAFVRASMGHAGENGYWTAPFAAEVVHLAAMGVWTGLVTVSAWKVLSASSLQLELNSMGTYLDAMSNAALAAVVAIFATGVFNAWHRVGSVSRLFEFDIYTIALLVKVGLVVIALFLGGFNKFVGLERARRSSAGLHHVRFILRAESFILLAVVIAAALLTTQQPPAAM